MKAAPEAQRRLLDLQAIDTALAQLAHRRRSLPELAEIETVAREICPRWRTSGSAPRSPSTTSTATSPGSRGTSTRSAPARTGTRPGSTPAAPCREIEALQHELATLNRRQCELEDAELELMEQRETAEQALDGSAQPARRGRASGGPRPKRRRDEAYGGDRQGAGVPAPARGHRSPPTCRPTWSRCTTRSGETPALGAALLPVRPLRRLPDRAVRRRPGPGQGRPARRGRALRGVPPDPGPHRGVRPVRALAGSCVEADGGSRGNPGPAGYGAVVREAATGEVLLERHGVAGRHHQQRGRVLRA